MPTPFTHLYYAQRWLSDPAVPAAQRRLLNAHRSAYLLGSVVADAHGLAGMKREETHFYAFDRPMEDHPWRVMLTQFPTLAAVTDPEWRAFLAGYVAHLSMDEIWSLQMVGPEFADRDWAPRPQRFIVLHLLLITLDERDLARLDPALNCRLSEARPNHWLPFLDDHYLSEWDDLIYRQIVSGGESETLSVYGLRLQKTPEELRTLLDSPERMHGDVWANVTPETTARVEAEMNDHARTQMIAYLKETGRKTKSATQRRKDAK